MSSGETDRSQIGWEFQKLLAIVTTMAEEVSRHYSPASELIDEARLTNCWAFQRITGQFSPL